MHAITGHALAFSQLDPDASVFQSEEVVDDALVPPVTKAQLIAQCEGDATLASLLLAAGGERHPYQVLADAGGPEGFLARYAPEQIPTFYASPVRYARASYRAPGVQFDLDMPGGFDAWVQSQGLDALRQTLLAVCEAMHEGVGPRQARPLGTTTGAPTVSFSPASSAAIASTLPAHLHGVPPLASEPVVSVRGSQPPSPLGVLQLVRLFARQVGRLRVDEAQPSWLQPEAVIDRDRRLHAHIAQARRGAMAAGYRVEPIPGAQLPVTGMTRYRYLRPDGHAEGFHRSAQEAWLWAIGERLGAASALALYATVLHGRPLHARGLCKAGPAPGMPTVGTVLHDWHDSARKALVYDHVADAVYHAADLSDTGRVGGTYLFARRPERQGLSHWPLPLAVGQAMADDLRAGLQAGVPRLEAIQRARADALPVRLGREAYQVYVVTLHTADRPIALGHIDVSGRTPIVRAQPLRSWEDAAVVATAGIPLVYPLRALDDDRPAVSLAYLQVAGYRQLGLWGNELRRDVAHVLAQPPPAPAVTL
ncbi:MULTISPECIES: hypothetical protein [Cupriavidus]